MDRATTNGGFPQPLAEVPARNVVSRHDGCGGETRVRLPSAVPPRAIRRVVCDRCARAYEPSGLDESPDGLGRGPRTVRLLSLPVASVAVLGVLAATESSDSPATSAPRLLPATAERAVPAGDRARGDAGAAKVAHLVSESSFQLALPAGWERVAPSGGATFAAVAPGGDADVTLWVERDPKLDFATFEARSLAQLESVAGSAGVVERHPGPTPEATSIRIAPTSAPKGAPRYEALLRASGDHWYYLATTGRPGAAPQALAGIELVQGSFVPLGGAR